MMHARVAGNNDYKDKKTIVLLYHGSASAYMCMYKQYDIIIVLCCHCWGSHMYELMIQCIVWYKMAKYDCYSTGILKKHCLL